MVSAPTAKPALKSLGQGNPARRQSKPAAPSRQGNTAATPRENDVRNSGPQISRNTRDGIPIVGPGLKSAPSSPAMPSGREVSRDSASGPEKELPILFQQFFKSENGRTYATQVKETRTGDHFLVLTDGKRDPKTDELRRSRLFLFREDFAAFFRMLHDTAVFLRNNPVSEEVQRRRAQRRSARDGRERQTASA